MKSAFDLGASFLLSIITLCSVSVLDAQSAMGPGSPSLSRPMTISDSGRALVEKPTDRHLVQGGLNGRIKDTTLVANLNPPISQTPLANPRSLYVQFFDGMAVGLNQGDDGITRTGMAAVDELNEVYGCTSIEKRFHGKTLKKDYDLDRSYIFAFRDAINVVEAREKYLATGLFIEILLDEYIDVVGGSSAVVPNDPGYPMQWALNNDSVTISSLQPTAFVKLGADMNMESAWDCERGDTAVIAAIIDTGCKTDHPDLVDRLWTNYGDTPFDGLDNDGNGRIDDLHGWDFRNFDNSVEDLDSFGHGTGIAGIIGAKANNEMGLSGVDQACKLMILKFVDQRESSINVGRLDSAIRYAITNGADVINFCYNFNNNNGIIRSAIVAARDADVIFVSITGNGNTNGDLLYPGAFPDSLNIVLVGATDPDDARSFSFITGGGGSNYTSNIDVVAPGNFIYALKNTSDTAFSVVGGTSAAAPHVVGLATLLKAQNPGLSADSIISIIQHTADDLVGDSFEDTPGYDIYHGYGRINAERALCGANSIAENGTTELSLAVFPNPSSGRINATISNLVVKSAKVRVYDMQGRLALAHDFQGGQQIAFDLSHANGLYMMEVVVNDRLRSVAKVLRVD